MEVRLDAAIQFAHGTVKNRAALHEKAPAMDPSCYWVRPRPTIHTILANGGVAKGKRFLSEAGCRKALELQIEGTDLVLGLPVRYGMGFGLAGGIIPLPSPNSFFWGGYGGSLAIIDMDNRATYAYTMNRMVGTTTGDMRAFSLAMPMWGQ